MPRVGFESAQNLGLDFVELRCAVVITTIKINPGLIREKTWFLRFLDNSLLNYFFRGYK